MKPDSYRETGDGYETPSERDDLIDFWKKQKAQAWQDYLVVEAEVRSLESKALLIPKSDGKQNGDYYKRIQDAKERREMIGIAMRHTSEILKELQEDKFETK